MKEFLVFLGASLSAIILAVSIPILLGIFAGAIGALMGYGFGLAFPKTFGAIAAVLGLAIKPYQLGAGLAFVGYFFRSKPNLSNFFKKSKETR